MTATGMSNHVSTNLPLSLWSRSEGRYRHPALFQGQVQSRFWAARHFHHRPNNTHALSAAPGNQQQQSSSNNNMQWSISPTKQIHSQDRCVESLDIHPSESSRYLLTGSIDGICSVYDLSSRGFVESWQQPSQTDTSHYNTNNIITSLAAPQPRRLYKPVARSTALTPNQVYGTNRTGGTQNDHRLGSVFKAQWYSVDTGLFLSGHPQSIAVWDTNEMVPVLQIEPFASEQHQGHRSFDRSNSMSTSITMPLSCMHLSTGLPNMVATGSMNSSLVKLVDIRTGAASHSLLSSGGGANGTGTGGGGVSSVQWSPVQPHVLASGGSNGQVRLWDIRKAGRGSWLVECFDPDAPSPNPTVSRAFWPDLSHLKEIAKQQQERQQKRRQEAIKQQSPTGRKRSKTSPSDKTTKKQKQLLLRQLKQQQEMQQQLKQQSSRGLNDYSASRELLRSHDAAIDALTFDPCGQYLVSHGARETNLKCWDLRDAGQLVPRRYTLAPHYRQIAAMSGVTGRSSTIRMHITQSSSSSGTHKNGDSLIYITQGTTLSAFSLHQGGPPVSQLKGHLAFLRDFCVVPDNECEILTSADDGLILAWQPGSNGSRTRTVDEDNW